MRSARLFFGVVLLSARASTEMSAVPITPATLPRIATVDERYQSYNVEMLEVTGGKFWKPRVHAQRDCCRKHDAGADDHHLRDDSHGCKRRLPMIRFVA